MADPPRRRRNPAPRRPTSSSSSWLPTIALGIGVVVAGLGIGAFLSAMQHKDVQRVASTFTPPPTVTPIGRATRGPIAIATPIAHATATPLPSATPVRSPAATATIAPTPTPRATATAHVTPTPSATATARATATVVERTASPRAIATPREVVVATPPPGVITPRPATPRPAPTPEPPVTAAPRVTPPTFAGAAQSTVRRYLDDLIAGNESDAYAALGRSPGQGGLSEEAFIDRGTRILSMRTTSTDPTGATIEVRLSSARGAYDATYHVINGPSGPIIDQHDYIRE